MTTSFTSAIDLNQNQILNPALQSLSAPPASPVAGQVYFDSVKLAAYIWNGTTWQPCDASESTIIPQSAVVGLTTALATAAPLAAPALTGAATLNGSALQSATTVATALGSYATLASPTLTGVPLAPTAAAGTNTAQIATCAFVHSAAGYVVGTIAALRANTAVFGALGVADVISYAIVGDGGGGTFIRATADTTSADNGGTIIVDAASQRWYRRISPSQTINVLWFGAYRNTPTDSTPAFAAAMAVTGAIYIPAGKYTFSSSLTCTLGSGIKSISMTGDGADETILYWPSGNGIAITYGCIGSSAHLRNFSVTTGATGGSTAGISLSYGTLDSTPAYTALTDITGVSLRGDDGYAATHYWGTAIGVVNVSNIDFNDINISGPGGGAFSTSGNGVTLAGSSALASFGVVYNFVDCVMNLLNIGITYGTYVQGVTFVGGNITGCSYGIFAGGGEISLDQLSVTASQFCVSGTAILSDTPNAAILVSDCLFILPLANSQGIDITSNLGAITGNFFDADSATGTVGVYLTNPSTSNTVVGNCFDGCAVAISLASGVSNSVVNGNAYYSCTTAVANAGGATNNIQTDVNGVTSMSNLVSYTNTGGATYAGNITAGTTSGGYVNKAGSSGAASAHAFNMNFTGTCVNLYIDTSLIGAITTTSDLRLKHQIQPMDTALDRILALRPVTFRWKDEGIFKDDGVRRDGFIAQEVQQVIPSAVSSDDAEDGLLVLNPMSLISVLVGSVQELTARVAALESR